MTQATAIHSVPITAPVMLEPARHCLFLDFDGTLVEFADRPDAVVLPETVRDDVARIHRLLDGAVAVVSGPIGVDAEMVPARAMPCTASSPAGSRPLIGRLP